MTLEEISTKVRGRIEVAVEGAAATCVYCGDLLSDIEWACRDGTSTANDWIRSMGFGAGMGLSNSKRVADAFDIQSELGKFTKVTCTFNLAPKA